MKNKIRYYNNILTDYTFGVTNYNLDDISSREEFINKTADKRIDYLLYRQSLYDFITSSCFAGNKEELREYLNIYGLISHSSVNNIKELQMAHQKYLDIYFNLKPTQTFSSQLVESFENKNSSAIFLIDGLPYARNRELLMKNLFSFDYDIHYLYHPGTMGASGKFNKDSLIKTNNSSLKVLARKYKRVYIISSSFGGFVANHLDCPPNVKKILMFSPSFNLSIVPDINNLPGYLKRIYNSCFPIIESEWVNLIDFSKKDNSTLYKTSSTKNKMRVFLGTKDLSVDPIHYSKMFDSLKINYKLRNVGHIGFSRIYLSQYLDIINELI